MSATASVPTATSTRRERWAWYLYDFGNSAYAAVVLLAIFSRYFQDGVVGGEQGSRLWGIAVGIAKCKKEKVDDPRPFHTIDELDRGHVYSIIASTRDLALLTEEQVTRELEMYAEAGIKELMDGAIKDGKLNYYQVLKKYSEA